MPLPLSQPVQDAGDAVAVRIAIIVPVKYAGQQRHPGQQQKEQRGRPPESPDQPDQPGKPMGQGGTIKAAIFEYQKASQQSSDREGDKISCGI